MRIWVLSRAGVLVATFHVFALRQKILGTAGTSQLLKNVRISLYSVNKTWEQSCWEVFWILISKMFHNYYQFILKDVTVFAPKSL
jgi:hypothetical protein